MLLAMITDTHAGIRGDNLLFHEYSAKFYNQIFFPYLKEHNITQIVHLGDMVDRRKYVNYNTAYRLRKDFLEPLEQMNIEGHFIVGNHDAFYKNTIKLNSHRELIGDNPLFTIFDEPQEHLFGNMDVAIIPWICDDNRKQTFDLIDATKAQVCFGHLEFEGFEMHKGTLISHGISSALFDTFDVVCSGHYHHRSSDGHIFYLGSHSEFTWSDYNDDRGFHIFDTNTRSLEFIKNPFKVFDKIWYDDTDVKDITELTNQDFSSFKDRIIKVIVTNKTNPYWFDRFIDTLEKANVYDLQVVEDHLNLDLEGEEDLIDEAESTLTICHQYIDSLKDTINKERLKTFVSKLYQEALELE